MTTNDDAQPWRDIHCSASDGLRLYGRHYQALKSVGRPAFCLAGLTRNSEDFHVLAMALAQDAQAPRDVYCLDARGRGRSEYDRDWRNYTPYVELLDALDFMTVAGLHNVAVLGTSRGGILTMLMAALRPTAIGVAILNDIGPEIVTAGLARIVAYVGRTPSAANWEEAARLIRQINGQFFPRLSDEEWLAVAHQWFEDKEGRPTPAYDPKLGRAIAQIDLTRKIPDTWPQFLALSEVPTLAIRGEYSDLLSEATFDAMAERHPNLQTLTVEAEGHAPLLRDAPTIGRIAAFLAATDGE